MSAVSAVYKIQSVQTEEYLIPFPGKGGDRVVTTPRDLPVNVCTLRSYLHRHHLTKHTKVLCIQQSRFPW